MATDLFVVGILLFSPAALWGALCAINSMGPDTRRSIAWSFLVIAWGWGAVIFAGVDYLVHGAPLFWPYLLLFGVLLLAGGNGLLHFANRRDCRCLGCPGQHSLQGRCCTPPAAPGGSS